MIVKIVLERKFKEDPGLEEIKTINRLRIGAMQQKGYIGGETLVDLDDLRSVVVISTWTHKAGWEAWLNSGERSALEAGLEEKLEHPPLIRSFMLSADYLGGVFEEVLQRSGTMK